MIREVLGPQSTSYEMVLNAQSLLVIRWDQAFKTEIVEHSLWDLRAPVQLNVYELYDYSIYFRSSTKRPVFAVSNTTGILAILGTKSGESEDIYVLVYKNNYPNVQALDRAVQILIGSRSNLENYPLEITVSGEDTFDIAYMTIKGESVALSLPKDPTLIIDVQNATTLNTYSISVDVSFKVMDMENEESTFQETFDIVRRETTVDLVQSAIDASKIKGLTRFNLNGDYYWSIPVTDWYFGPILEFKLTCGQCYNTSSNNTITISNRVEYLDPTTVNQSDISNLSGVIGQYFDSQHNFLVVLVNKEV